MNEFDRNLLFHIATVVDQMAVKIVPHAKITRRGLNDAIKSWEDNAKREAAERDRLLCERDAVRRKWGEDG